MQEKYRHYTEFGCSYVEVWISFAIGFLMRSIDTLHDCFKLTMYMPQIEKEERKE